jgi:hypothetical protein
MICTEFYDGQGLGNQLWLYVVTRVKSLDLGLAHGVMHPEKFKGMHFIALDFGQQLFGGEGPEGGPPRTLPQGIVNYYREPLIRHPQTGQDISGVDPEFDSVNDQTKIDGNFQSPSFIRHRKNEIKEWLTPIDRYKKSDIDPFQCVINFRGGEYRHMKDVFLPPDYWQKAREIMLKLEPRMTFKVVTDDPKLAKSFFPRAEVSTQDMSADYSDIFYARYLILSNSSFGWFPAWLNSNMMMTIAPKFWWGFNRNQYWSTSRMQTKEFSYLDRDGNFEFSSHVNSEKI